MNVPVAVKEILDILDRHLYDTLTMADVAKAIGKSETTVKNLFTLYRSGGIMRYYSSLKIKEAKNSFARIGITSRRSPKYCIMTRRNISQNALKTSLI